MKQRSNCSITESGVSELIGAIILIAMIVLVVAVVAAFLTNRPPSNEIPEVRFSVVNASPYNPVGVYSINLTHIGGDNLNPGEYSFFINDESLPVPANNITPNPLTNSWSVGKTVMVKSSVVPDYIRVYYYNTTKVNNPALLGQRPVGTIPPTSSPTATTTITTTTTPITTTTTPTPIPPPVANFTTNRTCGYWPTTVQFTDTSTRSPTSWAWNFGDSTGSTLQNPVHTYSSPGTYSVSLTASNSGGFNTKTSLNLISIYNVDFSGTPVSGTSPLSVSFTDLSTGAPSSWTWNFGDGSTGSERFQKNPVYTYSNLGAFSVSLTVNSASCGSGSITKTEYIVVTRSGTGSVINLTKSCGNNGRLISGTYFTWQAGNGERISVNNNWYNLNNNDIVKLEINGDQKTGQMVIDNQNFLVFTFNVKFYVNGNLIATGPVTGINNIKLNKNDNHGTLTYQLERCPASTKLILDGVTVIDSPDNNSLIRISNMNIIHDNSDPFVNKLIINLNSAFNQINCQGDIMVT